MNVVLKLPGADSTLDPQDWPSLRRLGHRMLDDMFDHIEHVRESPVWTPQPPASRAALRTGLPYQGMTPEEVYRRFQADVQPYATGNVHPGFMGWVHGGGTALGMLAEMLAAGLNANLGGRDHSAIAVERQVIGWSAALLGLPPETSGLVVTGTSTANLIAVLAARRAVLGGSVRSFGVQGAPLVAYASARAHGCIARAMDFVGLGSAALRLVPVGRDHRMDPDVLAAMLAQDRAAGHLPFLIVGTAGTVDIGATDDLAALATLARREGVWFHVDGAFGAMAALSQALRPRLAGIERADSVAFDFHKWMQVPYDAGCVLVRDRVRHLEAFSQEAAYLRATARGLAGGGPWPCDLGPELSRGFRALKVWMTWQVFGTERLGAMVAHCCDMAQALAARIDSEPKLQRVAPVPLNIVCFTLPGADDDTIRDLVADVQEQGLAAPSTTMIDGRLVIRAAIVNHRTGLQDIHRMVDAVLHAAGAY
jgi:glutamate/tyrosine decarboxylase-like PLP-dependent enzyme